jgi:hypothetical protein
VQDLRVVELAQRILVLGGQSRCRGRKLLDEAPQFRGRRFVDLGPLISDRHQRTSEVLVEYIFLRCVHLVAVTQNALEVLRRDEIGERGDAGSGHPGLNECRYSRMDLVTAQSNGLRRHGARPGIGRENVGPGTPRKIALDFSLEGPA